MELEGPRLDGMSIYIEKDKETMEQADYVFVCDVWDRDPRYKSRWMIVGQRRGLFRVRKTDLVQELLWPIDMDGGDKCFARAAAKVIALYREQNEFPARAQVAIG